MTKTDHSAIREMGFEGLKITILLICSTLLYKIVFIFFQVKHLSENWKTLSLCSISYIPQDFDNHTIYQQVKYKTFQIFSNGV